MADKDPRRRLCNSEKLALLIKQGVKCFYCGIHLKSSLLGDTDDFNRDPQYACTDHKISWVNGGKTDMDNCVMSCRRCNCKKNKNNFNEGGIAA